MEKTKTKRTNASRLRPMSDTVWWEQIAMPLSEFLSTWRSWPDLKRWRIENKVKEPELVNALAYLSIKRRARFHLASGKWGPVVGDLPPI